MQQHRRGCLTSCTIADAVAAPTATTDVTGSGDAVSTVATRAGEGLWAAAVDSGSSMTRPSTPFDAIKGRNQEASPQGLRFEAPRTSSAGAEAEARSCLANNEVVSGHAVLDNPSGVDDRNGVTHNL